ncbi:MAG: hypothetical protein PVJ56_21055 [Desulfobacterales bacterium]|jgi:ferredoxin-NADP reductase
MMSQSSESFDGLVSVELLSRRWVTENAFEIELTRPASFNFNPGQTIAFHHKSIKRYYSLISTPNHATLELCVQHVNSVADLFYGKISECINKWLAERPLTFIFAAIGK